MQAHDDVDIDLMSAADLPAVLLIENASFDDPWPEEVFKTELRHCWSHCLVLKRRADKHLLGYLVFWSVVDEVHLLNVAVQPDQRHNRYGRMLIDYLTDFARSSAARFITLEVRRSNEAALRLYESGGFKQVGVRPNYYANNGEDAIVMLYDCGSQSGVHALPAAPQDA